MKPLQADLAKMANCGITMHEIANMLAIFKHLCYNDRCTLRKEADRDGWHL